MLKTYRRAGKRRDPGRPGEIKFRIRLYNLFRTGGRGERPTCLRRPTLVWKNIINYNYSTALPTQDVRTTTAAIPDWYVRLFPGIRDYFSPEIVLEHVVEIYTFYFYTVLGVAM